MKYDDGMLVMDGDLTRERIPALVRELRGIDASRVRAVDLSAVAHMDSAGAAFIQELRGAPRQEELVIHGARPEVSGTLDLFTVRDGGVRRRERERNVLVRFGEAALKKADIMGKALYLTADIFHWSLVGLLDRRGQKKGAIIEQSVLIGVNAMGIIGLLSVIIGMILALQSAAQLRQFGANIFVAALIAVSMVREMGPMMTAIIVAGRSGSAFASEIATMQVTEEIDALRMMAIHPIRYVVVPKLLAITFCMPLLVVFSTFVGILGGMLVSVMFFGLTVPSFIETAIQWVLLGDIIMALGKSVIFSWAIVIIGSHFGFAVKGGAEGVGRAATSAVVASIFAVILIDVLFSFTYLGQ